MNQKGNILIATILVVILLIVFGGIYFFQKTQEVDESDADKQDLVGGDIDEHGCIGSAGFTWCEAKEKCLRIFEEGCDDQILELIDQVETESGLEFEQSTTTFDWMYEGEESIDKVSVTGLEFIASGVTTEGYTLVEGYFRDNLEPDIMNMASGVMGGLEGYWYQYNVCLVEYRFTDSTESAEGPIVPDTSSREVNIRCGYLNKNELPEISAEKQIKKLFADKYSKKVSAIELTFQKQTDEHIRGGVKMLDEDEPGNAGMFFAAKQTNEWKIVFDGNGSISCKVLEDNNFPEDMREGCFEE
ncbi:MAG: hypothetical protein ABIA91_01650 [Patescibacteria group bacterium]